jgi:hypothetical protein
VLLSVDTMPCIHTHTENHTFLVRLRKLKQILQRCHTKMNRLASTRLSNVYICACNSPPFHDLIHTWNPFHTLRLQYQHDANSLQFGNTKGERSKLVGTGQAKTPGNSQIPNHMLMHPSCSLPKFSWCNSSAAHQPRLHRKLPTPFNTPTHHSHFFGRRPSTWLWCCISLCLNFILLLCLNFEQLPYTYHASPLWSCSIHPSNRPKSA